MWCKLAESLLWFPVFNVYCLPVKTNEVIVYRVMMYANQQGYSVQSDDVR